MNDIILKIAIAMAERRTIKNFDDDDSEDDDDDDVT